LPEDEVLAQIVFGRSMTDLSPLQIARLASVAVELTGGNSPSLVDGLRETTGLDDIDVVQDDDGNAAVKAGKYLSDNVYLGVQSGQETEATINLDITETLKARGAVTSEGESSLGLFFEKDY
jgi:translocation and assembly module TamB